MSKYLLAPAILVLLAASLPAADVSLYFTDYMAPQSPGVEPALASPAVTYANPTDLSFTTADGKKLVLKDVESVSVKPKTKGDVATTRLFAAPGEYEPASFALQPAQDLEQVFIAGGALTGPAVIPADAVKVASVEAYHGGDFQALMPLAKPWNMAANSKELFWVTVRVPDNAAPGLYKGSVTVTSKGAPVGKLNLELEVLPIKLLDAPYALGWNYSSPKDPKVLAAHLKDMREHGMTTVAPLYNWHLPIYDDDTSEFGAFIEAYKAAGFKQPFVFSAVMDLTVKDLMGYGPIDSQRFQRKYLAVMRKVWAEAQRHDVPVLFSVGDEMTNKGVEGVKIAEQLARLVHEELPEMPTTSDMNGYSEVMAMAPYLNVATFNNGWDGADRHNKGKHLLNKDFILEVQKKGAIPWFVNSAKGRFPFGFFFWKMANYGVRGKIEWYYNLGKNDRGSCVMVNDDLVYPTLAYEKSREGIDDLRYIATLESLIAQANKTGKAKPQVAAAEALLKKISDAIGDDWTAYASGVQTFPVDGFAVLDPDKAAQIGQFQSIRRGVADAIIAIQSAK